MSPNDREDLQLPEMREGRSEMILLLWIVVLPFVAPFFLLMVLRDSLGLNPYHVTLQYWPMCQNVLWIAALVALCGCTPDMRYLQGLRADGGVSICVCAEDGHYYSYSVDAGTLKSDAVLEPELEAWKGAGFDGFGASYVTYVPDVCLSYKFMNSAPNEWPFGDLVDACTINFLEDVTVVNEVRRNGSSQYVRDATAADKRFRQFLLRCVAEGKFKRSASDSSDVTKCVGPWGQTPWRTRICLGGENLCSSMMRNLVCYIGVGGCRTIDAGDEASILLLLAYTCMAS